MKLGAGRYNGRTPCNHFATHLLSLGWPIPDPADAAYRPRASPVPTEDAVQFSTHALLSGAFASSPIPRGRYGPAVTQDSFLAPLASGVAARPNGYQWTPQSLLEA